MTRFTGHIARHQRLAYKIKIANGVQYLVFHEFVVVAQPIGIEHAVFVHDDGVIQTTAPGQACRAQGFNLAGKTEGTRTGDGLDVRIFFEIDFRSEEHTSELKSLMSIPYA